MAKGMNWWRAGRHTAVRHRGAINVAWERDRLDRDRAARWLNRHQSRRRPPRFRPRPAATAPSSATPPWE
jgi:hypothetical protein